jgi:hypothetical protein
MPLTRPTRAAVLRALRHELAETSGRASQLRACLGAVERLPDDAALETLREYLVAPAAPRQAAAVRDAVPLPAVRAAAAVPDLDGDELHVVWDGSAAPLGRTAGRRE